MSIEYIGKDRAKLVVSLGSRDNRKRFSKIVTITGKKDAERQYREYENEVKGGELTDMTVEQLLAWYVDSIKVGGGKATTVINYESISKGLSLAFKGRKAKDVTTYHIDRYITAELKKCTAKTIRNRLSLLSAAYKKAISNNMLAENPCENSTKPKVRKKPVQVVMNDDLPAFLTAIKNCEDRDIKVAAELAMFCGFRCAEIMGITEKDIDFKAKTISINKGRHVIAKEQVVEEPKTHSSNRVIAAPDFVLEDIKLLIKEHNDFVQSSKFLIQNQFGEPVAYPWLYKNYNKFLADNNLPKVELHELRHTHASMLVQNHFEVVEIASQLGHSQISTTMNIYSHLLDRASVASQKAAVALNEKWDSNGTPDEK